MGFRIFGRVDGSGIVAGLSGVVAQRGCCEVVAGVEGRGGGSGLWKRVLEGGWGGG